MPRLFGAALLAAASLVAGTWIGLGKPSFEQSHAWAEKTGSEALSRTGAAKALGMNAEPVEAADAGADVPSSVTETDSDPDERVALPHETNPESVPAMEPWPSLNPEADLQKAWLLAEGPQRKPKSGRRLVTLTFDDGPFLETTPAVLKLLARYKVHATFFAVGQYLEADDKRSRVTRKLLKRVVDEGHLVGNHTLDHQLLTTISHTRVLDQIDRSAAAIERATGKYPYLFRPPYGQLDDFGRKAAQERHLDLMLWSVEANDMVRDDPQEMFRDLVGQLVYKEGGIVLLHDIRFSSVATLRELLAWLKLHKYDPQKPSRPGFDVVDLPTYLRETQAAPMPYANREELDKARERAHAKNRPPAAPESGRVSRR